jgi:hypothetical protein
MQDMKQRLEKLRDDAAECAITSGLAETREKRELFARLAEHLTVLADEVEQVMIATHLSVRNPSRKRKDRARSGGLPHPERGEIASHVIHHRGYGVWGRPL